MSNYRFRVATRLFIDIYMLGIAAAISVMCFILPQDYLLNKRVLGLIMLSFLVVGLGRLYVFLGEQTVSEKRQSENEPTGS